MNIPIGPHQRQGRRRRRGKAVVLALIAATMTVTTSMFVSERTAPEKVPDETFLAYMRNVAKMSPGDAAVFVSQWPEYADEILGG